ncbi:MAG: hypothetical protein AB8U25_04040 [Rickettsiales endosymbiont of Dermacentor nuttalli]
MVGGGGNLKGLMHTIALKDPSVFEKLDIVASMTYDLGDKDCGGDLQYECPLLNQVDYFMN